MADPSRTKQVPQAESTRASLQLARLSAGFFILIALSTVSIESLAEAPSVCLFRTLWGIECLGCGMTRAMVSVMHMDFSRALSYNRLVILVFPAMVTFLIVDLLSLYRKYVRFTIARKKRTFES